MEQQNPEQKPKNNTKIVLIIAGVVILFLAVGGYMAMKMIKAKISQKIGKEFGEKIIEKAIENGTGQKASVNTEDKSVSIKTGDGSTSISGEGNAKLPDSFPKDVFVYGDAKIYTAGTLAGNESNGGRTSHYVTCGVAYSLPDVAAKYNEEMEKNGWKKDSETDLGIKIIEYKKEERSVVVTISPNEGENKDKTGVALSVN